MEYMKKYGGLGVQGQREMEFIVRTLLARFETYAAELTAISPEERPDSIKANRLDAVTAEQVHLIQQLIPFVSMGAHELKKRFEEACKKLLPYPPKNGGVDAT